MTSREFCYWLQGFFELSQQRGVSDEQADLIRRHLAMVFQHEIDPSYPNGDVLSALHSTKVQSGKIELANKEESFSSTSTAIRC